MLKTLTVTAASLAMLSAAAAADLPRKEPPPPAAPVGKAPIGKYPVGKSPVGKYPRRCHTGLTALSRGVLAFAAFFIFEEAEYREHPLANHWNTAVRLTLQWC